MDVLELIKDAALFGGTIPEERIQEVRDYFDKEQTKMPSGLDLFERINEILEAHSEDTNGIIGITAGRYHVVTVAIKDYLEQSVKEMSIKELADFLEFVDKMIPKIVFLKMTNKEVAEMYLKNKSLSVKEEEK